MNTHTPAPTSPNAPQPLAFEGAWDIPMWRSEAFAEDLDGLVLTTSGRAEEGSPTAWQQPLLLLVPLGTALAGLAAWMPVLVH